MNVLQVVAVAIPVIFIVLPALSWFIKWDECSDTKGSYFHYVKVGFMSSIFPVLIPVLVVYVFRIFPAFWEWAG